ncbi:MAG: hypothetical protein SW127_19595 [Actinomycetota bacterium]|nr:hypothetical protein [Actinomycetota bacterium]
MAEPDNEDRRGLTPPAGQPRPVRRAPLRRPRRPDARDTDDTDDTADSGDSADRGDAGAEGADNSAAASADTVDEAADRPTGKVEADPTEVEQRLGYRERRKRRPTAPQPTAPTSTGGVRYRGTRRSRGWIVGGAVGAVILVASLVAAVVFALGIGRITDEQELRQEYSTFAQQMVVNLTSLNADNVDDAMKTLEDKTSGRAHQQMQDSMKQAVSLVRDQNLDTKSTVISDAVTQATPDEGTVILVYGWQMMPENPDEQTIVQTFRWRVQITRINDELKMTNFEWVT